MAVNFIADNVLRVAVDTDVDTTDIFAQHAQQEHQDAANKENSGHYGRITKWYAWINQLADNQINDVYKPTS